MKKEEKIKEKVKFGTNYYYSEEVVKDKLKQQAKHYENKIKDIIKMLNNTKQESIPKEMIIEDLEALLQNNFTVKPVD